MPQVYYDDAFGGSPYWFDERGIPHVGMPIEQDPNKWWTKGYGQFREVPGTFGEVLNPATGKWEKMVQVDTVGGDVNASNGVMPESVAKAKFPDVQMGKSYTGTAGTFATNSNVQFNGGFMDDLGANLVLPGLASVVGSFVTPGISNIFNGATGSTGGLINADALAAGEAATTGMGSVPAAFDTASASVLDPSILAAGGLDPYSTGGILAELTTPTGASSDALAQLAQAATGSTSVTDIAPQVNDAVNVTPDWQDYAASADQAQFGTAYDGNAAAPITTNLPQTGIDALLGTGGQIASGTSVPATTTVPAAAVAAGAGAAAAGLGSGGSTVTSGGDVDLTGVGTTPNTYNADPNAVNAQSNTAIAKILAGTATAEDWAKLTGQALPGLLGAYASNQQSNTLQGLADRYAAFGAPSRARYEASMTAGFDPNTIPGYKGALDTASESLLRKLSASGGNPFGNPGGLIEANKAVVAGTALPAVQDYQRMNAGTGGLANLAAAYPTTQNAAAGSNSNVYNSLGVAAADIFNPRQSLNDLLKSMGNSNTLV